MKKIYQCPETEVIKISTISIMAGSPGIPEAKIDPDATPIDADEMESRGFGNIWTDYETDGDGDF